MKGGKLEAVYKVDLEMWECVFLKEYLGKLEGKLVFYFLYFMNVCVFGFIFVLLVWLGWILFGLFIWYLFKFAINKKIYFSILFGKRKNWGSTVVVIFVLVVK